jgi:hypothetical protein
MYLCAQSGICMLSEACVLRLHHVMAHVVGWLMEACACGPHERCPKGSSASGWCGSITGKPFCATRCHGTLHCAQLCSTQVAPEASADAGSGCLAGLLLQEIIAYVMWDGLGLF